MRDFKYNDVHKQLPFMHGGRSAYRGSDGVVCLNKQSGCEGVCLSHDTADLPLLWDLHAWSLLSSTKHDESELRLECHEIALPESTFPFRSASDYVTSV